MSYQDKFVIKNLRDGTGHVRNRTLNFKARNWEKLLGTARRRAPSDFASESLLALV